MSCRWRRYPGGHGPGMAWAFVRYSSDVQEEEQVKVGRLGVHAHGCGSAWEWRAEHGAWPPRQTGRPPEALTLLDRGRTLLPDSATATAVACEAHAACEKASGRLDY